MSSPIKHERPCVKSEPALMTRPGERVYQTVRRRAGDGRGASLDGGWHRRCCATGATDSANPANPGNLGHCAANQPRLPNPLARHRRTGRGGGAARGDGGIPKAVTQGLHPHRTIAWHVLPAYPRRCHYEGDRRTRRETLQSARCAPASRQDVQNVQKTFSKL